MKFEYQIQEKEFIKLRFFLAYRKPSYIFAMIVFMALAMKELRELVVFGRYSQFGVFILLITFYFVIVAPIINYFRFKREYRSSKPLQQRVISEITDEKMTDISDETKLKFPGILFTKSKKQIPGFYFFTQIICLDFLQKGQ